VLLFPPLAIWFVVRHWPRTFRPALVILVGAMIALSPYAYTQIANRFIDFGPWEKTVDGEQHLTLTGWDRDDYSLIRARPNVAVLQMANRDVTDETLDHLRGLEQLRELDLNNTQVTDAGLAKLKELPALRSLRLRGTQITDEGFREHLMTLPELRELDVRDTAVKSATMRDWRRAKSGRRGTP
jgi:hypothetical protein